MEVSFIKAGAQSGNRNSLFHWTGTAPEHNFDATRHRKLRGNKTCSGPEQENDNDGTDSLGFTSVLDGDVDIGCECEKIKIDTSVDSIKNIFSSFA